MNVCVRASVRPACVSESGFCLTRPLHHDGLTWFNNNRSTENEKDITIQSHNVVIIVKFKTVLDK